MDAWIFPNANGHDSQAGTRRSLLGYLINDALTRELAVGTWDDANKFYLVGGVKRILILRLVMNLAIDKPLVREYRAASKLNEFA